VKNIYLPMVLPVMLFLAVFLPVSAVQAQTSVDCAGDDVIAVCFDNGDINAIIPPNQPFLIYFCLINATEPWVTGFEFSLIEPVQPYFRLSETFPVPAINVGVAPDYFVGYSEPLPVGSEPTVVMTHEALVLDTDHREYYLQPTSMPSIPGSMAYATWDGAGEYPLIAMDPISGDPNLPVAQLNGVPLDYCNPVEPLDMIVNIAFDGDNDNIAGTSLGATDGFDVNYDFADTNTGLTFPHPEWNQASDFFQSDIRAAYDPTLELKQWTFVATATAGQPGGRDVTLAFQPNFTSNPDMVFALLDRNTGISYDLFVQNNLTFPVADSTAFSHTFDLFIGHENPVAPALWVDVTATSDGLSEAANRLSTNSLATDGYDADLDIPEPIHPPAQYVSSSFIHETWPLGPRFRTDARALFDPGAMTKTWDLRVETDQGGSITLYFGANFTAQDSIGLQLRDLQTGQTFNLFPNLNYRFQADGVSVYDFEIVLGLTTPPDPNPTSRQIDPGWALAGFPLDPAGRTLGQVIWDQAPGYAFMFEHQPEQGYDLLDPADPANQDKGYWIATDSGFNWTMTGSPNLVGQTIPLIPGWNLIGNPLWFPGPFEGLAVIHRGTVISWTDAVAMNLVATGVQSYDQTTGCYFDAIDLQPWQGYWINALAPDLQLVFNWENFQNLPTRMTADKSTLPVDEHAWLTRLTLWDADRRQTSITIGINAEATEGFDSRFDMPLPPAPPSGGPLLAFSRPEWNLASGAYFSRDVMPPSDEEMIWNAVIGVTRPGPANLVWDSSNWPRNVDFQLYLPTENRVIVMSMRNQSRVHLDLGDKPLPIVIRTPNMFSAVGDTPVLTYRVGVYPNPFNPMTTVSFDLPRAGTAEIRLYSVRGELINVLGGEHYAVGSHEVVWQGKDHAGRNVPSGSYFAKLYVDGQAMGPVTKMSLVR